MADQDSSDGKEHKFVIVGPDLNLSEEQLSQLSERFRNDLIATLGSSNASSRGEMLKTIIVQTECLTL
jgi:hypothetical protein